MADIKSPEERSKNMSKIRSKGTAPEEYEKELLNQMENFLISDDTFCEL